MSDFNKFILTTPAFKFRPLTFNIIINMFEFWPTILLFVFPSLFFILLSPNPCCCFGYFNIY